MDTEKEFKEIKERLDKIEKEIIDIKTNYLTFEKLTKQIKNVTIQNLKP